MFKSYGGGGMVPGITVCETGPFFRSINEHDQYGRRIEGDGTWTVYLVFSGIPARSRSRIYTGLRKIEATDIMHGLNAV